MSKPSNEVRPQDWTMVDLNGQPVIPAHDSNVGNWLSEFSESTEPRFWRMR